jgi:predicted SAM-dependent methyltransferase
MILNLGSGDRPMEGAINLDGNGLNPGVDVIHNLENGLPFEDSYFDEIYAYHILEHIHQLPMLMGEINRVGKNGCQVHIDIPHFTNPTFYDDISHVRPWTENTAKFLVDKRFEGKRGYIGRFLVLKNEVMGEHWSFEKPTVVVVILQVVKGE